MIDMAWHRILSGSSLCAAAERVSVGRVLERAWSEWLILSLVILAALVGVAAYVIAKIRAEPAKKEQQVTDWLSKYSDLHSKGGLSDEEFRTIKTKLAEQLQDELKGNGDDS